MNDYTLKKIDYLDDLSLQLKNHILDVELYPFLCDLFVVNLLGLKDTMIRDAKGNDRLKKFTDNSVYKMSKSKEYKILKKFRDEAAHSGHIKINKFNTPIYKIEAEFPFNFFNNSMLDKSKSFLNFWQYDKKYLGTDQVGDVLNRLTSFMITKCNDWFVFQNETKINEIPIVNFRVHAVGCFFIKDFGTTAKNWKEK